MCLIQVACLFIDYRVVLLLTINITKWATFCHANFPSYIGLALFVARVLQQLAIDQLMLFVGQPLYLRCITLITQP